MSIYEVTFKVGTNFNWRDVQERIFSIDSDEFDIEDVEVVRMVDEGSV